MVPTNRYLREEGGGMLNKESRSFGGSFGWIMGAVTSFNNWASLSKRKI